ncbi:hypothetical protein [Demequina gelatinilytica]|uniref:hypothetical protein n=1 Tax=Demequina gelatinilytica TaxID=1638980 RepID=UPI000785C0F1|nr:hypothetical protein [Demequina gelatinilytica]
MNPVPESVKAPKAPQVNLLPPEIEARRTQGRAKGLILFALLAFVLLLGGAWFYAFEARKNAEDDLAAEQAKTPQLTTELASYEYVNGVSDDYENSVFARLWAGATDIDWSAQLASLMKAFPEDIQFSSLQVTQVTPYATVGAPGTVFDQLDMGQVSFTGRSVEAITIPDLVDALNALPGFEGAWIEGQTMQSDEDHPDEWYEYTGSVRITYNALSGRTVTEQTEADPDVLAAITGEDS